MPEIADNGKPVVNVLGAGLAGCEACNILTRMGCHVRLYEMKSIRKSPAHHSDYYAELVCSNSLRAANIENAIGLLKEELRILGSLIMESADRSAVPAGGALAVDRDEFSGYITERIRNNPDIEIIECEMNSVPRQGITVVATGPLTDNELYEDIMLLTGESDLHFFDAAAPIVTADSIDMTVAFKASRYGKGGDDYINCPMNKEEYLEFYNELIHAERAEVKGFDKEIVFEGCMPIETMASRGEDTMRFGPLKPVGLIDPRTGEEPYACLQLRQDDKARTMYNIVGFQTRLKWPEQKRVFGLIPGLTNAEYYRMGVMHRNTYLNSPHILDRFYSMKSYPNIFFAGQITGVEGYIESTASGFLAGYYAAIRARNEAHSSDLSSSVAIEPFIPGSETVIGSMAEYISDPAVRKFTPMNANFGLVANMPGKFKGKNGKKEKNSAIAARSLNRICEFADIISKQCQE